MKFCMQLYYLDDLSSTDLPFYSYYPIDELHIFLSIYAWIQEAKHQMEKQKYISNIYAINM